MAQRASGRDVEEADGGTVSLIGAQCGLSTVDVYSRTVAFAHAIRWAHPPEPEVLTDHLTRFQVIVSGDSTILSTLAGQQAMLNVVNIICRFCPSIEVEIDPGIPLLLPANKLAQGGNLADAISAISDRVWGAARPDAGKNSSPSGSVLVSVGRPHHARGSIRNVTLNYGAWWGASHVNEADGPHFRANHTGMGLGSLVMACLGGAAVFKLTLQDLVTSNPNLANINTAWDIRVTSQCLSLLDHSLSASDDDFPTFISLTFPIAFISAGAICSAVANALHQVHIKMSDVCIFEPKDIDAPDLNRYLSAVAADLCSNKADLLASLLPPAAGKIICREAFGLRSEMPFHDGTCVYIVGVDDIPSRWEAQRRWPKHLLLGATEMDLIRVSQHRAPSYGQACARCLDPEVPEGQLSEVVPAISFVSALAGTMIAADLIKLALDFKMPVLANTTTGHLLQLDGHGNWQVEHRQRRPECALCGPDRVSSPHAPRSDETDGTDVYS